MKRPVWMYGVLLIAAASLLYVGIGAVRRAAMGSAKTEEAGMATAIKEGALVKLDYKLTVEGEVVDSSDGREPLSYVHGQGQIIKGLERELTGMHAGETKHVTIAPQHGYGEVDPKAFVQIEKERLPDDVTPTVGAQLQGTGSDGRSFQARISEINEESITLDLNHPLAGKTLEFDVSVADIILNQ